MSGDAAPTDLRDRLHALEAKDRARTELLDLLRGALSADASNSFDAVASSLGRARAADFVTISELVAPGRMRTLACVGQGRSSHPNFEYDIAGTPCENVVARDFYSCPDRVQERFPQDRWLVEIGAESYLGVPLFAHDGAALGNIAILARRPATDIAAAEELLRMSAVQVSAEIVRRRAERALREAQKLDALGRLAGGIAHDFNNLLHVILGTVELAQRHPDGTDSYLTTIRGAAERGAALTQQLLAFSRRQVRSPVVLDIAAVIGDMLDVLRRALREDIELVTHHEPDVGRVLADRSQLEQVILNLAVNAREAMPAGGRLRFELANVTVDERYARIDDDMKPGRYVLFAVTDTGIGMSAETLARAFEPFFTTKELSTGLGLATVQGIVQQAGGHVAADSELGRGTTIKVYLPRVDAMPAATQPTTSEEPRGAGTETILLVDDDPRVRETTRAMLEDHGYRVVTASDLETAKEQLQIAAPDLLVTDVVLPHVSGTELYRTLATLKPGLPVLYISAFTDATHVSLEPGTPFLQKPFGSAAIARRVHEVLTSAFTGR